MAEKKRRLTRADWTEAGVRALAEGGVPAVAVEPIAAALGATKGSGYWHFPNRAALLTATLQRWESEHTEAIIALLADEPDPRARLRKLLATVLDGPVEFGIELSLLAHSGDETIAAVLRRVTERRLAYLAEQLSLLGFGRSLARRRALLAYGAYLGQAQIARSAPSSLPRSGASRRAHLDDWLAVLLAPSTE